MPRIPLITALAAQLAAGALVFGGAVLLTKAAGVSFPLMALLAGQGIAAAVLGSRFGLASWWAPIHLVLPSAVAAALLWQVPAWVFLGAFMVLVLVFWNAATGGVPLYLTNPKTKAALAELLPEKQEAGSGETATGKEISFRFADLGSGLGGPVLELARGRPDGHFTGIESAPVLFALTWLRLRFGGADNVQLRYGDYRSLDLAPYDVVYCFLSPVPMPALYEKARLEMSRGSLLISNTFIVPDHPADETIDVGDRRKTKLWLWRM
jgi:hypothetical protein